MEASTLAVTILWSLLFIYAMLGSLDFGAGFWGMIYGKSEEKSAAQIANRFLSPTWEVTNVFLVIFVVSVVTFFPYATTLLSSVLLVPVALGLLLLTIRTTFMVFQHYAGKFVGLLRVTSGVTGLIIPALLVSILPITLGGFISFEDDYPRLEYGELLTHPTLYMHVLFGLSTELFISSVFLMDYAKEAEDWDAYDTFRKHALWLGPVSIAVAMLTIGTFPEEAGWIVDNIEQNWLIFGLSLLFFLIGYVLLFLKKPDGRKGRARPAVIMIVLQYGFAIYAYGSAHLPYLIYPDLTVSDGFTNASTFYPMLIVYAVGFGILIPAFYLFWRLFLKDRRYLKQQ
ncbi:cytochrome d ubiquinol oxidase subunit II [Halobacillus kuroshimensis]|uniref:Cytochrome d ubiquinol oxidase subunit II n=1 Tax=Halobacillus kuroshimensis TaxID=302481 RepID=A0ABS3E165_9BACI|nr:MULTISPECIES: cytochrome d ubiquinol oxidase subunit II [Halobacillus]MBN8237331.1 cytochrome d ubiquinol oxidase subunit II [Halobacillus kuroshimensis]